MLCQENSKIKVNELIKYDHRSQMHKDVGDFIDLSLAELKLMPLSPGNPRNKSQFNTRNGNVEKLKQQNIQHQPFSTSVVLSAIKPGFA